VKRASCAGRKEQRQQVIREGRKKQQRIAAADTGILPVFFYGFIYQKLYFMLNIPVLS
jgi:hypothetical protein